MTLRLQFRRVVFRVGIVFACCGSSGGLFAAESIEDVLSATFRVTDRKTSATCFVVERDVKPQSLVLVTAAHFFEQATGDECWVMLRTRQPDDSYVRHEHRLVFREESKPRWKKHPDQDLAVLAIELPDGVECTPIRFQQIASEADLKSRRIRVAQETWIPGFPAQLEANPAGWPVLRRGSIATHPLVPLAAAKTMIVHVSSFGGDSGSPVFVFPTTERNTSPLVAGVLLGMHRQTDKSSSAFEERTIHTPLDLAIVVQGPLVREAVELLAK